MTLAQWDTVLQDGQVNAPVTLTGLGSLLDAIEDTSVTTPPVAGAMTFTNRFQGLRDDMITELRVENAHNAEDYFIDNISNGQSTRWAAGYIPGYGDMILTSNSPW
jgi:hypothetical protein